MSTFLASFDGYWRRPSSDYKYAVRSYRIAVDTNVLLELYRFTPKAREELLQVLRQLRDRLWLPHQVAAEYYDRRISALKEHLDLYATVPESLTEQEKKVIQDLNNFAKRCSIGQSTRKQLIAPIEQAFKAVTTEIAKLRSSFDLSLEQVIDSDPILAELAEIFDGRTGLPFTDEEAQKHLKEAQKRGDERIPPGYKDTGKERNAHGDYFIWEQLLASSAKDKRPLLFVTNDAKEDWVRKEAGLTVGARPELVQEFTERCDEDFLLMQPGRFLQVAKEELGLTVSASTVAEAENIRMAAADEKETFVVTKSDFIDLTSALHSESRIKPFTSVGEPTDSVRKKRRRSLKAGTVLDNLKLAATVSGNRVSFQLSRDDWQFVKYVWKHLGTSSQNAHGIDVEQQERHRELDEEVNSMEARLHHLIATADAGKADELRELLLMQKRIDNIRAQMAELNET